MPGQLQDETSMELGGAAAMGWEAFAYMKHVTSGDTDQVYILKNDQNGVNWWQCAIAIEGSNSVSDLMLFVNSNNDNTTYCGRSGVHAGLAGELRGITHNDQYASNIVPALETCSEVACVGHSKGGAMCNLFTMCANVGLGNMEGIADANGWDDYSSLIWTKKKHE